LFDILENLKKKETLCLSRKALIGSHPSSASRAHRSLKPTQHIDNHNKDNIDNKLNGMIRILGKHGNFNRIEFGNALWNSVLRPTAAHGFITFINTFSYY
jgi:hypothetical protein